jgi:hypothetical protein
MGFSAVVAERCEDEQRSAEDVAVPLRGRPDFLESFPGTAGVMPGSAFAGVKSVTSGLSPGAPWEEPVTRGG